jgi:DNA-binding CsgD family transcriptional regulator
MLDSADMSIDERTLAVIEAFYDAAMDEERWVSALQPLMELTGSQAATFWVLSPQPRPELTTFRFLNFDPEGMKYYLQHTAAIDPTNHYLLRHPDVPVVHDGLVISEREKDHHPYYDWHGSFSDTRYRLVGQASPAPSTQAGVALHRTRQVGKYEPGDIERFAFIHRHMAQALSLGFRLGTLGTMQKCTAELLDRSSAAILLLDERKRVVFLNRGAQSLQMEADGVRLSADALTLVNRQDNNRLQQLIAQALTALPAGYAMRATRPSGKPPYAILVGPASRKYSGLSALRPAVCIVITNRESTVPFLKLRLQAVYGLTEAESRLAALLADGQSLRAAALKLGITYGTCRSRLAEIFAKTETRSQHELVALLLKTLAA